MAERNHTAMRIIDVNLNRAREALRVLEDYARYNLEDKGLTLSFKELRHRLASVISDDLMTSLALHRNIVGDIGRDVTTESEGKRRVTITVAGGAGKGLGVGFRSV